MNSNAITSPISASRLPQRLAALLSHGPAPIVHESGLVPAGVIVPLLRKNGVWHLLFTLRSLHLPNHAGQFSFPGGVAEETDDDLLATALRETHEEIGVLPRDVTVLGSLEPSVTPQGFRISPFVGAIPYPYEFKVSPEEVSLLLDVPLPVLLDPRNLEIRQEARNGVMTDSYFYRYNDHIIWGATARIVKRLLDLMALDAEKRRR
ncbi:MAG: CoA pyrophosphatase [Chloroflexi bacterium]|nr:CoA pyrophosphatase [Chloroflexota bacterium]